MIRILEYLAEHGGLLLAGATVLLAAAVLSVRLIRAPVCRQRVAELTLLTTLCWLVLAAIPLPRLPFAGWGIVTRVESVTRFGPMAAEPPEQRLGEPGVSGAGRAAWAPSLSSDRPLVIEPTSTPMREGISRDAQQSVGAGLPLASSTTEVPWRTFLAALYLVGSGVCLGWLGVGHVLLIRTVGRAADPEPWLLEIYRSLRPAAELRRVRLLVSPRCRRPMVFGLWHPRVVLPSSLCVPANAGQLRAVLLHELAHAWRGDAWGHGLFNLACPLLYGHPFYWWLRGEAHFARELIADDWAARFGPKHSYVEELVRLARGPQAMMPGVMGVLGVFRLRTQFYRRMTMLIDRKHSLATSTSRRWMLTLLIGCATLLIVMAGSLGVSLVDADQPAVESAPEQPEPEAAPKPPQDSRRLSIGGERKAAKAELGDAAARRRRRATDVLTISDCRVTMISDIAVPAQTGGVLMEVAAEVGAPVERGQLLAQIDDSDARLRLEAAQASLGQVKLLEIRLDAAKREAHLVERDHARVGTMAQDGVVSESELASARLTMERAQSRVREAEEELRAAHLVGDAEVRAAKAELDRTRITAPIDGIVVERYVDQGEWIKEGDPICRVIRMDRLRAEGLVLAEECAWEDLTPGQEVEIAVKSPWAGREISTLPGQITFVSPLMSTGNRYQLWAEFENLKRDGQWVMRPGLEATVIVKQGRTTRTRGKVSTGGLMPDGE